VIRGKVVEEFEFEEFEKSAGRLRASVEEGGSCD